MLEALVFHPFWCLGAQRKGMVIYMAIPAAAVAKAAAMLLTNEKARKGVGWILVAVFSPVILLIALLCSLG